MGYRYFSHKPLWRCVYIKASMIQISENENGDTIVAQKIYDLFSIIMIFQVSIEDIVPS